MFTAVKSVAGEIELGAWVPSTMKTIHRVVVAVALTMAEVATFVVA